MWLERIAMVPADATTRAPLTWFTASGAPVDVSRAACSSLTPTVRVRSAPEGRRRMILALLSWSLVVALGGACSRPTPTRVPTLPPPSPTIVAPTRSPTPSLNSAELFGTDEQEIQEAFTTQVLHVTDQAQYLAGGSCEKLGEALNDDPQMFSRIRGLAEILRRQYSKDQVLAQPAIQRVVADMDAAIGELNHTLSACGIGAGSSPG